MLVPRVQFGFATPGTTKSYHNVLLNRFQQPNEVELEGSSLGEWSITVDPTSVIAQPGISETIDVDVSVPVSPTFWGDIERVTASTVITPYNPYTTMVHLITIVRRVPFSDVTEEHWADGPVQYLANSGVINGYGDGTFRPNNTVSRAQFAKMLVGAMGWELVSPDYPTFADVTEEHWAYAYIETAYANGVINGYTDGSFRPEAGVTRAQLAKMVSLSHAWWMDLPDSSSFVDVLPTDWFYSYAEMMAASGTMSGYTDGTFRPGVLATRAQVAKILTLSLYSNPNE